MGQLVKLTVGKFAGDIGKKIFGGHSDTGDDLSIAVGYELADKFPNGSVLPGAVTAAILAHYNDYVMTDKVR